MNRLLSLSAIILSSIGISAMEPEHTMLPDASDESYNDTKWLDHYENKEVHLQRFNDTDTLVVTKPKWAAAILEDLGINAGILAFDRFVQNRDYARVTGKTIKDNINKGWVWDNDSFSGNQFSHPYHGAMFYNTARENGIGYYPSLLFPLIGSFTWEVFCETNRPAINDLLSTGVGGSAIGEVAHRVSDLIYDDSKTGVERIIREISATFLNPVRGAKRLFSGEMWRRSASRGKTIEPQPYSLSIGLGDRIQFSSVHHEGTQNLPYIDFSLDYGEHFTNGKKVKPYELFSLYVMANLSSGSPSIGLLDIKGRLASLQLETKKGCRIDLGFYQMLRYLDSYGKDEQYSHDFPVISEAVSFGGGAYCEKDLGRNRLSNDLIVCTVPLGGANNENYPYRRYNFGYGFSIRNNVKMDIMKRLTIGNEFYMLRLFVPKKKSPEEIAYNSEVGMEIDEWGCAGETSVLSNRSYISARIAKGLNLNMQYQIFYRHSDYKGFDEEHGRCHECKLGLFYSL